METRVACWLLVVMLVRLSGGSSLPAEDDVKVITFNIRYGSANDGENAWPLRREQVFDVLREVQADFCGLQEALRFQIDEIRAALPEYGEYGRARTDGGQDGEYSAILYVRDRWQLQDGATVWLSDTPDQPGSTSWGNTLPRIVTWGRFREKSSGRVIAVFNTHFDHQSQPSRERSAEFLARLVAEKAPMLPVIVTGDFNAGEQNPAIQRLVGAASQPRVALVDSFRVLHPDEVSVGTFNGFAGQTDGEKIDYILCRPETRVVSAAIVRTHREQRYPSDHFPVTAELRLGDPP